MFDHTGIGVSDIGRSAAFYGAALSGLGLLRSMQLAPETVKDAVRYGVAYPVLRIDCFQPHSVKQHTALSAPNARTN